MFVIFDATVDDTGYYQCSWIQKKQSFSDAVHITVLPGNPRLLIHENNMKTGSDVTMTCISGSDEEDDKVDYFRLYQVTQGGLRGKGISTDGKFTVSKAQAGRDDGLYYCSTLNLEHGKSKASEKVELKLKTS